MKEKKMHHMDYGRIFISKKIVLNFHQYSGDQNHFLHLVQVNTSEFFSSFGLDKTPKVSDWSLDNLTDKAVWLIS